jgi:hypothetical protein
MVLVWWLSRINSDWVRLAAEAYAQRVLATTETLETKPRKSQQFGWPRESKIYAYKTKARLNAIENGKNT